MRAGLAAGMATIAAFASMGGELTVEPGGMSPHQALAKVRAAKAAGDRGAWTINVKEGVYGLKETLVFTPADSGTGDAPVAWICEGRNAVFAGGEKVVGWKDVGGGVWSAPIPRAPDGSPAYFEQLWVDGRRADRARLPNRSPDRRAAEYFPVTRPMCEAVSNAAGKVQYSIERVTLTNETAKVLAAIPRDELPYAQMLVIHQWSFARRILRGIDPATMTVETHGPTPWSNWQRWTAARTIVCFENVRSAFDVPGEWFYDAKAGAILYRPLPGEDMAKVEVYAPTSQLSRLVDFRGDPDNGGYVHDIVFRGIEFAYSAAPAKDGERGPTQSYQFQAAQGADGMVTAEGARDIVFDGCRFVHTGNYALRLNDGCVSNTVSNCTLFDLGAGGVWMGARKGYVAKGETLSRRMIRNLAPRSTAFNRIENCVIRSGGRFNPEGTGVAISHASDCKVLHCDIHDHYYTGVSVGWTWGFSGSTAQRNEIAYNRIYDLGKGVMSDMGGVYTLAASFGTRVHHNVVHDVWCYSYGGWALYTDEGSEGITMDHNLCWNTSDGGFTQHYGSGCVIRNNIFAWTRSKGGVRMSRKEAQDVPCTLNFVNNIVVVRGVPLVGDRVRGVGGVWACNLWYDYSGGKPRFDGLDWEGWRRCGKEVHGVYADPRFENAESNDFRLKADSPAFALGFEAWDYTTAGCR